MFYVIGAILQWQNDEVRSLDVIFIFAEVLEESSSAFKLDSRGI